MSQAIGEPAAHSCLNGTFTFGGTAFAAADVPALARSLAAGGGFASDIGRFLLAWFDGSGTVEAFSSGSTGTPKKILLAKSAMVESARRTCSFLQLHPGDTALLCMPLQYVGAKMMVVRALVAGLDLRWAVPSRQPLAGLDEAPCFAAITPMQAAATLTDDRQQRLLRGVRHLLLGGSSINRDLARRLKDFPHAVWSTYGMTETVSHVALRRLSGAHSEDCYRPLAGVRVSLSDKGTLAIDAPGICARHLVTNDIAEIAADGSFRIVGRADNVINSGGIKIQIETAEELLHDLLPFAFMITSVPDPLTGERAVMLVQGPVADAQAVIARCKAALPRYWAPKAVLGVGALPLTGSGKPDRPAARRLAAALCGCPAETDA